MAKRDVFELKLYDAPLVCEALKLLAEKDATRAGNCLLQAKVDGESVGVALLRAADLIELAKRCFNLSDRIRAWHGGTTPPVS